MSNYSLEMRRSRRRRLLRLGRGCRLLRRLRCRGIGRSSLIGLRQAVVGLRRLALRLVHRSTRIRRSSRIAAGRALHAGEAFILQQAHFYASARGAASARAVGAGLYRSIAQAQCVDAIHRDLMVDHQVAHYRVRHLLRVLHRADAAP